MSKNTQKSFVKEQLALYGEVTRNQCLERRITRLGAIICDLKSEGYELEGKWRGGDYVYVLSSMPPKPKKPQFIIKDGVAIMSN